MVTTQKVSESYDTPKHSTQLHGGRMSDPFIISSWSSRRRAAAFVIVFSGIHNESQFSDRRRSRPHLSPPEKPQESRERKALQQVLVSQKWFVSSGIWFEFALTTDGVRLFERPCFSEDVSSACQSGSEMRLGTVYTEKQINEGQSVHAVTHYHTALINPTVKTQIH